ILLSPRQMHVMSIRAGSQKLSIARRKVAMSASEVDNLRRAYESKVHGPEEDDLPFSRVVLVRDVAKFLSRFDAHVRLKFKFRKSLPYSLHDSLPEGNWRLCLPLPAQPHASLTSYGEPQMRNSHLWQSTYYANRIELIRSFRLA